MRIGRTPARILIVSCLAAPAGPASAQDSPAGAGAQASRPVRVVYPGPNGSAAVPARATSAVTPPSAAPQPETPNVPSSASASATPEKAPSAPAAAAVPAPAGGSGADTAAEPADATLVDINSASSDELDRLGGRFGKAIVRGRPYQSIDELVSRRILNRSTFGQIRDRIVAR